MIYSRKSSIFVNEEYQDNNLLYAKQNKKTKKGNAVFNMKLFPVEF